MRAKKALPTKENQHSWSTKDKTMIRVICAFVLAVLAFFVSAALLYWIAPMQSTHVVTPVLPMIGIALSIAQIVGTLCATLTFARFAKK